MVGGSSRTALDSSIRDLLVLVLLDEQADDLHERGERVALVVADFVHELVEQGNQASTPHLRVRDEGGLRELGAVNE